MTADQDTTPADRTWTSASDESSQSRPFLRIVVAALIGLAAAVIIWIIVPYYEEVIGIGGISGSYMPAVVLFLTLGLVLGVNPLARRFRPHFALNISQLAMIVGIMLVACSISMQGLLALLPYCLAKTVRTVRDNKPLAEVWVEMDLPESLFPDPVEYGADTPASDAFMTTLRADESIPWAAWVGPLLSWGVFMFFCWLLMVGLAMIVLPQWQRNERLPFPLLTIQQSLIETPEPGHLFAPMFRQRSMWIAALLVFGVHLLAGSKVYHPDAVPAIPFSWNLGSLFTEGPLRYLPGHIKANHIYFVYIGVAYFMPTRISFSIWFFELAYGLYAAIGQAYFPPYQAGTVMEHRTGTAIGLTLGILWLGRAHWKHVFVCMVRRPSDDAQRANRQAGLMFVAGSVGMFGWLCWMGVPWAWSIAFVAVGFMVSLLITRIFAETGMPFMRISCAYPTLMIKMAPMSWLSPVTLVFATVITTLFNVASRVNVTTMAAQALALDKTAPPRRQGGSAWMLVGVLVLGLVICGASHLFYAYHHSSTLDGRTQPLGEWGSRRFTPAYKDLEAWRNGQVNRPIYNQPGHIAFGAGLAAALQWASVHMPRWPFHPIGLLMVASWYTMETWVTIFFGWLVKLLILRFGGARLYRAARPIFMGLIIGDVFAVAFWGLVPLVLVKLGFSYLPVQVHP